MSFWDFQIKCNLAIVGLYLIPWSLSIATPYAQEKKRFELYKFRYGGTGIRAEIHARYLWRTRSWCCGDPLLEGSTQDFPTQDFQKMSFWDFQIKCNLAIVGLYLIPWSLSIATPYAQEKKRFELYKFRYGGTGIRAD